MRNVRGVVLLALTALAGTAGGCGLVQLITGTKPAQAPVVPERRGIITRANVPLTLLGPQLEVGDKAPDFSLLRTDMSDARPDDFAGKTLLLVTVPSLDTKVCDIEARRFNEEAAALRGVSVLVVSMDLPFAQARWCGAHGIKNLATLSDYRTHTFGRMYGVLIKEMQLLARTIFVIGPDGRIRYIQIVRDISNEPDYAAALKAARAASGDRSPPRVAAPEPPPAAPAPPRVAAPEGPPAAPAP